jgi:hypothetical protein
MREINRRAWEIGPAAQRWIEKGAGLAWLVNNWKHVVFWFHHILIVLWFSDRRVPCAPNDSFYSWCLCPRLGCSWSCSLRLKQPRCHSRIDLNLNSINALMLLLIFSLQLHRNSENSTVHNDWTNSLPSVGSEFRQALPGGARAQHVRVLLPPSLWASHSQTTCRGTARPHTGGAHGCCDRCSGGCGAVKIASPARTCSLRSSDVILC